MLNAGVSVHLGPWLCWCDSTDLNSSSQPREIVLPTWVPALPLSVRQRVWRSCGYFFGWLLPIGSRDVVDYSLYVSFSSFPKVLSLMSFLGLNLKASVRLTYLPLSLWRSTYGLVIDLTVGVAIKMAIAWETVTTGNPLVQIRQCGQYCDNFKIIHGLKLCISEHLFRPE